MLTLAAGSEARDHVLLHKPLPGAGRPLVFSTTSSEMHAMAIRERVLVPSPPVRRNIGRILFKSLKWRWPVVAPLLPMDRALTYVGAKRRRYVSAAHSLIARPVSRTDATCSSFTKREVVMLGDKPPVPRTFNFPRYRLILALNCWLKPMEDWLYKRKGGVCNATRTYLYAKNRNSWEIAQLIVAKFLAISDCVVLIMDESRFEARVNSEMLGMEERCFQRMGGPTHLLRLMRVMRIKGASGNYVVKDRLCSGRPDTSFVACLTCVAKLVHAMELLDIMGYDILDAGDDELAFVPMAKSFKLQQLMPEMYARLYGAVLKISPCTTIESIVFCQTRPVLTGLGWRMVRNPRKILCGLGVDLRNSATAGEQRKKLAAKVICELECNRGMPVIQAACISIGSQVSKDVAWAASWLVNEGLELDFRMKCEFQSAEAREWLENLAKGKSLMARTLPVTDDVRLSYCKAWSILVEDQLDWEKELYAYKLELGCPERTCIPWGDEAV